MALRLLSLLALLGIAIASPLPQELNRDAEIVPDDIPLEKDNSPSTPTFFSPPRRHFIAIRPLSLGDIFGGGERRTQFPFLVRRRVPTTVGSQDPIFGSPSFVDVPADSERTPSIPATAGDSPLHRVFEDMIKIQRDLIGSLFNPQTRVQIGQRPVPETDTETDVVVDTDAEEVPVQRPAHSFISQLIPAIFGAAGGAGSGSESPFRFPNFGDLPADFDNSTYKEEEIDGQIVRVNETIKRTSTPFGSSVFHFKVYSLKPDGTEETIEDVEIPQEVLPTNTPAQLPEQVPEQLPEQFPEQFPNLPEQLPEPLIPQEQQEQVPLKDVEQEFQLPALDESLNEIP